jgi:hypothetical protein
VVWFGLVDETEAEAKKRIRKAFTDSGIQDPINPNLVQNNADDIRATLRVCFSLTRFEANI